MRSEEVFNYADAWVSKLLEWADVAEITSAHSAFPQALELLSGLLPDLPELRARELVRAFSLAFKISEEDAWVRLDNLRLTKVEEVDLDLPETAAKRDDFPPVSGLTLRYVNWLSEQESPAQYHAFSFLTVVSAAIERRAMFNLSGICIFPNLYTILVGPSGARKDSAIDYAISMVDESVGGLNILAGEGSQQGYAEQLSAREGVTGNASGLITADELKVLFGGDKYKAELIAWLTEWYKCSPLWSRVLRGSGELALHNIYICLLGGTTEEWLKGMPDDALAGGFLQARALVIPAKEKKHWKFLPGIDTNERRFISEQLTSAFSDVPLSLCLTKQAETFMREWYEHALPKLAKTFDDRMQPYFQRIHVHALKFAVIDAVLRGIGELDLDAVDSAIKLALWAGKAACPLMAELDTRETIYADILAIVKKAGKGIHVKEISRKLRNKYQARLINDAVTQLIDTADLLVNATAGGRIVTAAKKRG